LDWNLYGEIGAQSYPHDANYSTSESFLDLTNSPSRWRLGKIRIASVQLGVGPPPDKGIREVLCGSCTSPGPAAIYRADPGARLLNTFLIISSQVLSTGRLQWPLSSTSSGPEIPPLFSPAPFSCAQARGWPCSVRGNPNLVVYPSRPGRSGISLHPTGMMAMLHGLRVRNLRIRVALCPQRPEDGPGRAQGPLRHQNSLLA
jgi:hypothetical protein